MGGPGEQLRRKGVILPAIFGQKFDACAALACRGQAFRSNENSASAAEHVCRGGGNGAGGAAPSLAGLAGLDRLAKRTRQKEELAEAVRFELTEELPLRQFSSSQ